MTRDRLNRNGYKVLAGYFASPVLHGAIIFGCAGRMDLPWIWVYLVVSFIGMFGGIVPVCIRNPVLINHRGDFRRKKDTMPWDRWLVPTYGILSCYLTPAVIGLDVGRYGWSDLGPVTAILGIAGFWPARRFGVGDADQYAFQTTVESRLTGITRSSRPGRTGCAAPATSAILWNITTPMMARRPRPLFRPLRRLRFWFAERPGRPYAALRTAGLRRIRRQDAYRLLPGIW